MLHYEAVNNELLALLKYCMGRKEFSNLRLVGGTDLALQYGHRKSVDIDLFGSIDLEVVDAYKVLQEFGQNVQIISKQKKINIYIVNGVKVDFVNYDYPWLKKQITTDFIRLASIEDVAAMKLNAMAGKGSKKDFIDFELLLEEFTLKQILDFYKTKYIQVSEFMDLKSLLYFADADLEAEPEMLRGFNCNNTKETIKQKVEEYFNS